MSDKSNVLGIIIEKESSVVSNELSDYDQPTPFSPGPYTTDGVSIFARDGRQVGTLTGSPHGPANASLLATSWELFTMLHEYVSTDRCTSHPEGETCRYCVSMNVIRRAFGTPDEQVPLLTWFAQYKEQRQIRNGYKRLYEKEHAKIDRIRLNVQERILELGAKQDRVRDVFPDRSMDLASAVAELSMVMGALQE